MDNHSPLGWDEERAHAGDVASRTRAQVLLALAVLVILWVFSQGIAIWQRLPDRIPYDFGPDGMPEAWATKGIFSVFGLLLVAAVILVGLALLRLRPQWYNFPGKEKVLRLPPEQRAYIYTPINEAMAWLASGIAIGMSLMCRETWLIALEEQQHLSPLPLVIPLGVGMSALIISLVVINRRLRELENTA